MTIAWNSFTPWSALTGGLLIGLAAALLLLLNGRVAGISGIVGALLRPVRGDVLWRVLFVAGLLAAPWVYRLIAPWPTVDIASGDVTLLVAGLLVGVGTRYAAGCTSGHGVCGLSRLSPRSLVATAVFMGAGFVTVALLRHVLGWG